MFCGSRKAVRRPYVISNEQYNGMQMWPEHWQLLQKWTVGKLKWFPWHYPCALLLKKWQQHIFLLCEHLCLHLPITASLEGPYESLPTQDVLWFLGNQTQWKNLITYLTVTYCYNVLKNCSHHRDWKRTCSQWNTLLILYLMYAYEMPKEHPPV